MAKNNRSGQSTIISDVDYRKIRKHLNNRQQLLLDIAWYTGERWGAIVQLLVTDVYADPSRSIPYKLITFRAATRKGSPDGRRTTRQIPIHPQLEQYLLAFKPSPSGWLFPARLDESRHISLNGAAWFFCKAIVEARLAGKGISTHSTRRSFITHLHEKGVDIRTIQQITGHSDLKSLQRYVEVSPERVASAIALL